MRLGFEKASVLAFGSSEVVLDMHKTSKGCSARARSSLVSSPVRSPRFWKQQGTRHFCYCCVAASYHWGALSVSDDFGLGGKGRCSRSFPALQAVSDSTLVAETTLESAVPRPN